MGLTITLKGVRLKGRAPLKETMMTFSQILAIYLVGCFLSFITLKLCTIVQEVEDDISVFTKLLGVSMSWIVIFLFIGYMIVGVRSRNREKSKANNIQSSMTDSERICLTIENYWVPATKYGKEFDPHPELPIHNSPLCEKYYQPSESDWNKVYCKMCPIHKAGFGCTSVGFFLKYQKSSPENAKRSAMILGKVFSDIYEGVSSKERYNRKFR